MLRHFRWPDSDSILDGATVIDLFAGTGAWGIEAASNGAASAVFVESHPATFRTLQDNVKIALHGFESQRLDAPELSALQRDALAAYKGLPQARVVFCDPPYDKGWLEKIVAAEAAAGRIVEGGLFLYEARDKEALPAETPTLRHYDTKNYGDSSVHYFVKLPA